MMASLAALQLVDLVRGWAEDVGLQTVCTIIHFSKVLRRGRSSTHQVKLYGQVAAQLHVGLGACQPP